MTYLYKSCAPLVTYITLSEEPKPLDRESIDKDLSIANRISTPWQNGY